MSSNPGVTHLLQSLNTAVQDVLSERASLAQEAKSLRAEVQRLRSQLATRDAQYAATRHAIFTTMRTLTFLDKDLIIDKNSLPSFKEYLAVNSLPASSQGVSVNPFLPSPFKNAHHTSADANNGTTANSDKAVPNDFVALLPAGEGDKEALRDTTSTGSDPGGPPPTDNAEKNTPANKATISSNPFLSEPPIISTSQVSTKSETGKQLTLCAPTATSIETGAKDMCTLSQPTETGKEPATGFQTPSTPLAPESQAKPVLTSPQASHKSLPNKNPQSSSAACPTTDATAEEACTRSRVGSHSNSSGTLNHVDEDAVSMDKHAPVNPPSAPENSNSSPTRGTKVSPRPSYRQRRLAPRLHGSRVSSKLTPASSNKIKSILGDGKNENMFAVGSVSGNRSPTSSMSNAWALGPQPSSSGQVPESASGSDSAAQDEAKATEVTLETGERGREIKQAAANERQNDDIKDGRGCVNGSGGLSNDPPAYLVCHEHGVELVLRSSDNSSSSAISANGNCGAEKAANSASTVKGAPSVKCRVGCNGNLVALQGSRGNAKDTTATQSLRGASAEVKKGMEPYRRI